MKNILLFTFLFISAALFAQAPLSFNYQGVARDNTGNPIASKSVCLRLSILDNSATGSSLFTETHSVTTNQFGLFTLAIGGGSSVNGTFSAVSWSSSNTRWLKVEMDDKCAGNYNVMGTSQFLSVPYAMYALNPGPKGDKGDKGDTGLQGIQGIQGQNGLQGIQGVQGIQGIQGVKGDSGSANINGSTNYIVKFTSATSGVNSGIYENNGQISIGTTTPGNMNKFEVRTNGYNAISGITTDSSNGVYGYSSGKGTGVYGLNDSGGHAVRGYNIGSTAGGAGVSAYSLNGNAIKAISASTAYTTIQAENTANGGTAIVGYRNSSCGSTSIGVLGFNASAGSCGIYGYAPSSGYAGYFGGPVHVQGNLSKSSGSFLIDHPLDPENKYLYHSFVESPDMMNIYNGNITTDSNGFAVVELPSYFQAENISFRYQLTVIGQFAQAIVADTIQNNHFSIRTDKKGVMVSWMVTGIRNDKYAQQNRIVPEVEKKDEAKGKYLNPEAYGKGQDKAIHKYPVMCNPIR